MTATDRTVIAWAKLRSAIRWSAFFVLFFLLVRFWVDPRLSYYGVGQFVLYRVFVPGVTTILDAPAVPGGAVEYLAAWLAHFNSSAWAGALIVTATAGLLLLATDRLLAVLGGPELRWLRSVPPVLVLMQCGRYYAYRTDGLAVLFGLSLVLAYMGLGQRSAPVRAALFVVFSAAVYVAASEAFVVCVVLLATFEFFTTGRRALAAWCVVLAAMIPGLLGRAIFQIDLIDAYRWALPAHPRPDRIGMVTTFGFYLFYPAVGIAGALYPAARQRWRATGGGAGRFAGLLRRYRQSGWAGTVRTAALLALPVAGLALTVDRTTRIRLRVDYFADRGRWPQTLAEARKLPAGQFDEFVCHDVNRALFYTGRLAYDMFRYPQRAPGLLLYAIKRAPGAGPAMVRNYVKRARIHLELGELNRAEHDAHEALEHTNYNPTVLKQLAIINIAKRRPGAARVFLTVLSRSFLYGDWARRRLRGLDDDPLFAHDPQIRRLRRRMVVQGRGSAATIPAMFRSLLKRDPHNRMAFEYLMAFCMLTGDPRGVAHEIKYLDNFDYPQGEIPRLYEEAVLVYTELAGSVPPLYGRSLSPISRSKFTEFMTRRSRLHGDTKRAASELAKDFGDSYYYFCTVSTAP